MLVLPWTACAPASKAAPPTDVTTIGGASYRLPDEAFADGVIERGPRQSLLLELSMPAAPDEEAVAVQVLLVASSSSPARAPARGVLDDIATGASIAASLDPRRRGDPLRPSAQHASDAPAGLVQVTIDPSNSLGDDIFVRPPIAHTREFIACSRSGPFSENPICSQQFAASGILVKASYPRALLPGWNRVRSFVLNYLHEHQVAR